MKRLLNDRQGAAGIFAMLAFFLALVFFGGLTIDVGILYVDRRQMSTAADAGALAASDEMQGSLLAVTDAEKLQFRTQAASQATNLAKQNGADTVDVQFVRKDVLLKDGIIDNREVVIVTAKKTQSLFLFRFLNQNVLDVSATSTATWGFLRNVASANVLPLFVTSAMFDTTNTDYLRTGRLVFYNKSFPNQSFFLQYVAGATGANSLPPYIEGTAPKLTLKLGDIYKGESGVMQSKIINSFEKRMQTAATMKNATERRGAMFALIPVITDKDMTVDTKGNILQCKISFFAFFEIQDIVTKTNKKESLGSIYALNPNNGYKAYGVSQNLATVDSGIIPLGTLIGKFTGEKVSMEAFIMAQDQTSLLFKDEAKYSKLIQ